MGRDGKADRNSRVKTDRAALGTYSLQVESWLGQLQLAPSTCAKLRSGMKVVFNHARPRNGPRKTPWCVCSSHTLPGPQCKPREGPERAERHGWRSDFAEVGAAGAFGTFWYHFVPTAARGDSVQVPEREWQARGDSNPQTSTVSTITSTNAGKLPNPSKYREHGPITGWKFSAKNLIQLRCGHCVK